MKNSILGKARWLLVAALATGLTTNAWGAIAYGTYLPCTSTSDLAADAHYIIANGTSGTVKCISNVENSNNRKVVSASVSSSKITVAANSTIMTFTLGGSSGAWTFHTDNYAGTAGYLASAASGKNNYCRVISTAGTATISFSSNEAVINIGPHSSRTQLRYNTSDLFACYSSGQSAVYMFRKAVQGASNNTNYGTVSVAGDVITATPKSGYQVSTSNPYTISPTGKATVSQSGNVFTLTNVSAVVTLTVNFEAAAPSCDKSVTINAGTNTNCTFTLSKSGVQASCDGVSTTVSITPNTGYGKNPSVTQSGASAAPTITGSGNSWTVAYGANTTGTSTINVSCSANDYIILFDEEEATTSGDPGIDVTYDSNENLTSAITIPIKTGWTFGGYYTAKNGGGTQIIDASGNVIASAGGGSTYTDASKNWKYANDITLYAKWTCTVTWSVNGLTNVYSTQTVTYNSSGCKVASVPGPPSPASYCGDVFAGWSRKSAGSESKTTSYYNDLFTNVAGSPELKTVGDVTFYAVFADYTE